MSPFLFDSPVPASSSRARKFARLLPAFLLGVSLLAPAFAQPMVDQVPADAIVYLGWTSGQPLKEAYANSHLKKLVDDSNLAGALDDFLPRVIERAGQFAPDNAQSVRQVSDLIRILLKHPTAFYFQGVDLSDPERPLPLIGLVCDADTDAGPLEKILTALIAEAPHPMARVQRTRDRISLKTTSPTTRPVPATQAASSLRFEKSFASALTQVHSDPTTILYIDMPRLLRLIDLSLARAQNPQAQSIWTQAVDLLGLRGVHQAIWTADFEGANWGRRCYIAAPAPRKGLVALLAGQPVSDDLLKAVPSTASMLSAAGVDAAAWFDEIHAALGKIDPQLQSRFDDAVQNVQTRTGVDLKKDFLDALGPDWASYLDPNLGGTNLLGGVYINRLRDPAKAQASLSKLEGWLNQWTAQKLADTQFHVQFKEAQLHGVKVHYLATPALSPAWAIADGRLFVSFYPEITAAAVRAAGGKSSILDNVSFTALRTRMIPAPGQPLTSVRYIDLPQFAPHTYASWLMLSRLAGIADLFGVDSPLQIMPPLATIMNELTPAAAIRWSDNAGIHSRALTPFPGSELLMVDVGNMYQQTAPVLASIVLPSLNRAREAARRVQSASKLRQIGIALALYAQEHNGRSPDTLGQLLPYLGNDVKVFFKLDAPPVPPEIANDKAALADWVTSHSDYIYIGAGKQMKDVGNSNEVVTAYERVTPHSEGANALFGDGHIQWFSLPELKDQLKKQDAKPPVPSRDAVGRVEEPPSRTPAQRIERDIKMRQTADRLRQIGEAIKKYSDANQAPFPTTIAPPSLTTKPAQ